MALENFKNTRKITRSEKRAYYIHMPPDVKLSTTFSIASDKGEFRAKVDARNRLYIKNLYKKYGLKIDQKISISRKNDKYYFTAF